LTTRETSPVGKNHQRQLLTIVEISNSLCCLEGGVRVPNTTSLVGDLLNRVGVGGVSGCDVLNRASLNTNDTDGNTTETSTTDDNSASPATKSLLERALVEQTRGKAIVVLLTVDEMSDIVRLLLGREEGNVTVPGIGWGGDGDGVVLLVRDERHPFDNLWDTLKVITSSHVRNTVLVHNLGTTKLQIGGVHLATEKLVNSGSTSEDDGLTLNLDGTLTKTDEVGTDTDGTASNEGDGEDILVSSRCLTSDETGALQTLNTKTVLSTNDGGNDMSDLTVDGGLLGDDVLELTILEASLLLGGQVEVLKASLGSGSISPCNGEVGNKLLSHTDTGTGVGRQVDSRNTKLSCQLGTLVEESIFGGTERTDLESDIVGNDDETSATRVLGGLSGDEPCNHTNSVGTGVAVDLGQVVCVIKNKLVVLDALARDRLLVLETRVCSGDYIPAVLDGLSEELGEIVDVLSAHDVSLVTLRLQSSLGGVRSWNRTQVHGANLGAATDALEIPVIALLGLTLGVQLNLDDVTRSVVDQDANGVGLASGGVSADDANLDTSNAEAPSTTTESVKESSKSLLDLTGGKREDGREVDEDVVQIGVVVADNLQSIKDVGHESVGFGDHVLNSRDVVANTTGTDNSTGEVTLVVLDTLTDGLVNVDVAVLGEDGCNVELGQTSELKLEGKSRLNVTNGSVFLVGGTTESVVAGVSTILVTTDECQATNTACEKLVLVLVDNGNETGKDLGVVEGLSILNSDVADCSELISGVDLRGSRLALSGQIGHEASVWTTLLPGVAASKREDLKCLWQVLVDLINVLDGNDCTLASRLILGTGVEVAHIADGVHTAECSGPGRGAGSGGVWWLNRQAELRLTNLTEREVPGQDIGSIVLGNVIDSLELVSTVSTASVDLESSQRDPRIGVDEELGKHIEYGVLGVNDLLDDLEAGLTVVPTSLTVARLKNRGAEDVLHLRGTLLEWRHGALNEQLTSLQWDLSSLSGLELGKLAKGRTQVLGDVASTGHVGAVVVEDSDDEVVLRVDTSVRQSSVDNLDQVILVLVSESKDNLLITVLSGSEEMLNIIVLLEERRHDTELVTLEAVVELGHNFKDGTQSRAEGVDITGSNVLLEEASESLLELLARELGATAVCTLNNLLQLSIKLCGHTRVESRCLSIPLAIWQLGIAENSDELLECVLHDDWVVETLHDALENVVKECEALGSLVAQDLGRTHLRELTKERLSRLDSGGIVERQYTKNITGLESGSGLLDEVDKTVLLSDQRHVHLHDFDFGKGLTLLDVLAVLDGELNKLTRRRSSELSGVVLLLEQASLAIDTETGGTNLLLPVGVVTATVKQDEQTTVGKRSHTDGTSWTVDEECVAIEARASDSELVTRSIVDEVDGEDSLENVLGGDLTLLQADTVLGCANVTGDVSLGNGTRDDGQDGIGALGGELLGDQLVEPSSGDGVVLEGRSLEQLDEVLNSGSKVTTNAQFLESNDHLLTRSLSVFTVGENVTKLRIWETVNGWSSTDWEVTPDVCAGSEVQLVHGTAWRLEALTGVLGGDTAGSGVALGLRSALVESAALLGEVEIDLGGGVRVNTVKETDVADAVERKTHSNL
jgi:hypothetical protein